MATSAIAGSTARADEVAAQRRRAETAKRGLLLAPAMLIIGIFGVLPLIIILIYSFLTPGTYGGVVWEFSTSAYVQFLFERQQLKCPLVTLPRRQDTPGALHCLEQLPLNRQKCGPFSNPPGDSPELGRAGGVVPGQGEHQGSGHRGADADAPLRLGLA